MRKRKIKEGDEGEKGGEEKETERKRKKERRKRKWLGAVMNKTHNTVH